MALAAPRPAAVVPADLFRYDPPVSPETVRAWQREVDRAFPPADRISRLVLRWEPGDAFQPIQRFTIWQAQDPRTTAVPPFIRDALRGPNPRATGHYCAPGHCLCPMKANRWRGGANRHLDRETWALYRDTGLYGRRWWTVQGDRGGHRFTLDPDELEAKLLQLKAGVNQTPAPGDLPYAPFDARVLHKIARLDQVKTWTRTLDFCARNADHLDAEQKREAIQAREALWQWIDWGIDEAWDEGGAALKQHLSGEYGRDTSGDPDDLDYEAIERAFTHEPAWD